MCVFFGGIILAGNRARLAVPGRKIGMDYLTRRNYLQLM